MAIGRRSEDDAVPQARRTRLLCTAVAEERLVEVRVALGAVAAVRLVKNGDGLWVELAEQLTHHPDEPLCILAARDTRLDLVDVGQ